MMEIDSFLIGFSVILLICALTSKLTGKLGVPALLVFIGVGMGLGTDGLGIIDFNNAHLAQMIGITALILILFSGGLDTEWKDIRPYWKEGLILSTVGVLLTTVLVGVACHYLLNLPWLESLLLGAIVSSTDAAAVFSVLRAKSMGFSKGVRETLELESGSNDPMAVFLTVGLIQLISLESSSGFDLIFLFVQQMIVGAVVGVMSGRWMRILINKIKLEYEGLYPIVTVSCVFLVYGLTQKIGGNGFLAVYIAAVVLSESTFIHRKSLMITHDSIAWMMQIVMFLTLGLLLNPTNLIPIASKGIIIGIVLMFFARPISVYLSLLFSKFNFREKTAISWLGLRGAMPIILATYPLTVLSNTQMAELFFNLVFFVVLTSTLIQGISIKPVVNLLRVSAPAKQRPRFPFEYVSMGELKNDVSEFEIPHDSCLVDKSIAEINLPDDFMILLVRRNNEVFAPRGGTIFCSGDVLLTIAHDRDLRAFRDLIMTKLSDIEEGQKVSFPQLDSDISTEIMS